jgi:hypothetical protein
MCFYALLWCRAEAEKLKEELAAARAEGKQQLEALSADHAQDTARLKQAEEQRLREALAKNDAEWSKRLETERAEALSHMQLAQEGKDLSTQLTEENARLKDDLHNVCSLQPHTV